MLGAKSALAVQACGLVLTTGLLAIVMTPSTALHADGSSSLAAFKHAAPDVAPESDQSSAYGFGSTFPADPPAEPYLGPDRPYEKPVDYMENGDDRLSVSDGADASLKRSRHGPKANPNASDELGSEQLIAYDGLAASTPSAGQDNGSSEPESKDASGPSNSRTADLLPAAAQTQVPVSDLKPQTP